MKYLDQYLQIHKSADEYEGTATYFFKDAVLDLIQMTHSDNVLDYGAGKGFQYSKLNLDSYWAVEVDCYEPAVEQFNKLPSKKYDGVICIEVLDHVPYDELSTVLNNIFERARKFVCLAIFNKPARLKLIDNGQLVNSHTTILPEQEWCEIINKHNVNNIPCQLFITNNLYNRTPPYDHMIRDSGLLNDDLSVSERLRLQKEFAFKQINLFSEELSYRLGDWKI